jgi:hypothetical protein
MYTKQQASLLRQEFWTSFGKYMAPIPSASGEKTNWINYKTGIRHIAFKMEADNKTAFIAIEITHSDASLREHYFKKFELLKSELHSQLPDSWQWQLHTIDPYGKQLSRIWMPLENTNIFDKKNWPQLISFFKQHMIALDAFWNDYKEAFYS